MSLRFTGLLAVVSGCGGIEAYGALSPTPEVGSTATTPTGSSPGEEPGEEPSSSAPAETTAEDCTWSEVPPPADAARGATMAPPPWLGVSFVGIVDGDRVRDYQVEGAPYSALLRFDYFDADMSWMCQIVYDASAAVPSADPWSTASGASPWSALDVPLGASASTCGMVNGRDPRELLEASSWGIGFGPLEELAQPLQDAVVADGGDWEGDWAPYTFGVYVRSPLFDASGLAVEAGYATSYDRQCDAIEVDADAVPYVLPAPVGALEDFVSSSPVLLLAL